MKTKSWITTILTIITVSCSSGKVEKDGDGNVSCVGNVCTSLGGQMPSQTSQAAEAETETEDQSQSQSTEANQAPVNNSETSPPQESEIDSSSNEDPVDYYLLIEIGGAPPQCTDYSKYSNESYDDLVELYAENANVTVSMGSCPNMISTASKSGGCRATAGQSVMTTWYYDTPVETIRQACSSLRATFIEG